MLGRGGVLVIVYHPALLRMKKKKSWFVNLASFYSVNNHSITDSQLPTWRSREKVQTGVSRLQHTLSTLVQDCPKPEVDISLFLKHRILFYLFKNCFNFWMFWVFVAVHGFSLVAVSGGYSLVVVSWLLIVVASLVEHRLYSARALAVVVHGLVALKHVECPLTRDQTHILCIGWWILNYWPTRKVLVSPFDIHSSNRQLFIDPSCTGAWETLQKKSKDF